MKCFWNRARLRCLAVALTVGIACPAFSYAQAGDQQVEKPVDVVVHQRFWDPNYPDRPTSKRLIELMRDDPQVRIAQWGGLSLPGGAGRALLVTLILIALAILATLTVNPMAAYALSRFNISGKDKVILFLLATMAFPAMVSAIPAYLLMRDLGLLNTFFALVLPSAANGMAIFILKGFFDSLPRELYEAATIDGAKEWQIFLVITMPMMKPILAIKVLNAFIHAYNGWEWALIICQDTDMWTLAVWMYQANQWWAMETPWLVMAGFVVVSIPTLIVFTLCQGIIMRGIILPQMK